MLWLLFWIACLLFAWITFISWVVSSIIYLSGMYPKLVSKLKVCLFSFILFACPARFFASFRCSKLEGHTEMYVHIRAQCFYRSYYQAKMYEWCLCRFIFLFARPNFLVCTAVQYFKAAFIDAESIFCVDKQYLWSTHLVVQLFLMLCPIYFIYLPCMICYSLTCLLSPSLKWKMNSINVELVFFPSPNFNVFYFYGKLVRIVLLRSGGYRMALHGVQ